MSRVSKAAVFATYLISLAAVLVGSPAQAAPTSWLVVSAGGHHTCAIRTGTLYCWGSDYSGQLGNGSSGEQSAPQKVTAATDWKNVSAGYVSHTCAIRSVGKLYCWGQDDDGEVGNGATITGDRTTPQQITRAEDWKSVSAGVSHTCAVRGKLYCWGSDEFGAMGNGSVSTVDQLAPQQITTAADWTSVSAVGEHTCAIRSGGKLYCWGHDNAGQVGNGAGSSLIQHVPQQITTATDWKHVSAGYFHTCAIRASGKLYCWGSDKHGQLGNGAGTSDQPSPVQITRVTDWTSVSTDGYHTCATRVGKLYCWGWNDDGQVGNGGAKQDTGNGEFGQPIPQQITTATDWRSVSAGSWHTCAIRAVTKLYCWGTNDYGELGTGTAGGPDRTTPVQITIP